MRRVLMMLLGVVLVSSTAWAYRSKRPQAFTDLTNTNQLVELNNVLSDLWNLTNGRYTLENLITNPQDVRKGTKGDLVYATFGGNDHLCVSTSFPEGKNWTCVNVGTLATCPGGADTQVQFNDNGNCGGDPALIWDKNLNGLGIGGEVFTPSADLEIDPTNVTGLTVNNSALISDNQVFWLNSGVTVPSQFQNQFLAPTINGVSGGATETVTNTSTVYIDNESSGSDVTLTNSYALWADAGSVKIDDDAAIGPDATIDQTLQLPDQTGAGLAAQTALQTLNVREVRSGALTTFRWDTSILGHMTWNTTGSRADDQYSSGVAGVLVRDLDGATTISTTNKLQAGVLGVAMYEGDYTSASNQAIRMFGVIGKGELAGTSSVGGDPLNAIKGGFFEAGTRLSSTPDITEVTSLEAGDPYVFGSGVAAETNSIVFGGVIDGTRNYGIRGGGSVVNLLSGTTIIGVGAEHETDIYDEYTPSTQDFDLVIAGPEGTGPSRTGTAAAVLYSQDSSITLGDSIGFISWRGKDTSQSTSETYARIDVQSENTITTDQAPGRITFSTTPTTVGAQPTERMRIDSSGDMTVTGIVVAATVNTGFGAVELAAGVWTPTTNNIANLDGSSASEGQYLRVGSTVSGSVQLSVNPTLTATSTQLELDLPVASNFGVTSDAAGSCGGSDVESEVAEVRADATSDELEILWVTTSLASHEISCSFSYQVI